MRIVVDSYAWIELFLGSKKGEKVREVLEKASEVQTPDIVLAEISRKYLRERFKEKVIRERLESITESSEIVGIDMDVALEAAKQFSFLKEKARSEDLRDPSLFDAIVLATARNMGAELLTGDQHFRGLPKIRWLGD